MVNKRKIFIFITCMVLLFLFGCDTVQTTTPETSQTTSILESRHNLTAYDYQHDQNNLLLEKSVILCDVAQRFLKEDYDRFIASNEIDRLWDKGYCVLPKQSYGLDTYYFNTLRCFNNKAGPFIDELSIGDSMNKPISIWGDPQFEYTSKDQDGWRTVGWRFKDFYFIIQGDETIKDFYLIKDVNLPDEYNQVLSVFVAEGIDGLSRFDKKLYVTKDGRTGRIRGGYINGIKYTVDSPDKMYVWIYSNYQGSINLSDIEKAGIEYTYYPEKDFVFTLHSEFIDHPLFKNKNPTNLDDNSRIMICPQMTPRPIDGGEYWILHYNDMSKPDEYYAGMIGQEIHLNERYIVVNRYYTALSGNPDEVLLVDANSGDIQNLQEAASISNPFIGFNEIYDVNLCKIENQKIILNFNMDFHRDTETILKEKTSYNYILSYYFDQTNTIHFTIESIS